MLKRRYKPFSYLIILVVILLNHEKGLAYSFERLNSGDTIQFVAPSSMIFEEALPIIESKLEQNGLKAVYSANLNRPSLGPYYEFYKDLKHKKGLSSNTEDFKIKDFQNALSSDYKVIWVLRGGFGCEKIMAAIDREEITFPIKPKIIIGFSDITSLHLYYDKMGWQSLHAIVGMFSKDTNHITNDVVNKDATLQDVIDVIMGNINNLQYSIKPINEHALNMQREIADTTISGGNIRILADNIGTSTAFSGEGKIVFLEGNILFPEAHERTFMQLIRAGTFNGVKALILGAFLPPVRRQYSEDVKNILIKRFADLLEENDIKIPVFHSQDFGHGEKNFVLPFGFRTKIVKEEEGDGSYKLKIALSDKE